MRHMGWSWSELEEAPVDLVHLIVELLNVEAQQQEHRARKGKP